MAKGRVVKGVTVDRSIPIPKTQYPLDQLKPGESFVASCEAPRTPSYNRTYQNVRNTALRLGVKITTKYEEGGIRVWRL